MKNGLPYSPFKVVYFVDYKEKIESLLPIKEELVSQEESSHHWDNISEHLVGETVSQTMRLPMNDW